MLMCFDLKFHSYRVPFKWEKERREWRKPFEVFLSTSPQTCRTSWRKTGSPWMTMLAQARPLLDLNKGQNLYIRPHMCVATAFFWVSPLCHDTQSLPNVQCGVILYQRFFITSLHYSVKNPLPSVPQSPDRWLSSFSAEVIWSRELITVTFSGKFFNSYCREENTCKSQNNLKSNNSIIHQVLTLNGGLCKIQTLFN